MTNITFLPGRMAREYYDKLNPLFEHVIDDDTDVTLDAFWAEIETDVFQLWIVNNFESFITTRIDVRHTGRIMWAAYMAGENMPDWVEDAILFLKGLGEKYNCKAVEFWGRNGYKRKFKHLFPPVRELRTLYRIDL